MSEPMAIAEETPQRPASPPGRFWAIGVLVLAALVSMSMNTWHAFTATTLPEPLAFLYGVAPVALAAMQSHAVALRALRKEKVGAFRRMLTFALVIGGLGLSFLGIYDLLRHAVPDPISAVPVHEPAVFFSIVIDLMALAALHELLRESPSFVHAVQATEVAIVPAVPEPGVEAAAVEAERGTEAPAISPTTAEAEAPAVAGTVPVHDPFAGVPPQVVGLPGGGKTDIEDADVEPVFSDQVQPEQTVDPDAPYRPAAVAQFLAEVASGEPPSVRMIKERMGVGTDRARRLRAYLGHLVGVAR